MKYHIDNCYKDYPKMFRKLGNQFNPDVDDQVNDMIW